MLYGYLTQKINLKLGIFSSIFELNSKLMISILVREPDSLNVYFLESKINELHLMCNIE